MRRKAWIIVLVSLLLTTGCSLPGLGKSAKDGGVVIAGGNTTERQILAEILKQMIDYYIPEAEVTLVNNLGSTFLIHQAMMSGAVNVSGAMYTGTSLMGELGLPSETDPQIAFNKVVEAYYERFDEIWFPSYGFDNTYAFMVTKSFAEKNNVKTISDLKELAPTLKLGVDSSWIERDGDGYQAFKEKYEFDFKHLYPMEIGLVYSAIKENEMDIVLGYSTDGRINSYDLVILEDDRYLFPPYDASPCATVSIMIQYPQLEEVLLKLEGSITNEDMQYLNKLSDEQLIEPMTVAKQFLLENNYFIDKQVKKLKERDNATYKKYH